VPTTVASWFDSTHKLRSQYQRQLDDDTALITRGKGRPSSLSKEPATEQEIQTTLQQLRAAGTPINTLVIQCVMRAIIEERCPHILQELQLSKSFVAAWVRSCLNWRWRARTTAASKLPADWESQGINMAMRIAAQMEMYKVNYTQHAHVDKMHIADSDES
jgi:hypothetical protein